MSELLHDLIEHSARRTPDAPALQFAKTVLSYAELAGMTGKFADGLIELGIDAGERVAVYLEKKIETVVSFFGTATAGAVFVPVNPILRPHQVQHILRDCNVRVLITSAARLSALGDVPRACHDLRTIVLVDEARMTAFAELVSVSTGMGARMGLAQDELNMEGVIGWTILLVIVNLGVQAIVAWAEKRLLKWRPEVSVR